MQLINSHRFTNDRVFEMYHLSSADTRRYRVPECDVLGLRRVSGDDDRMTVMRPDEALILARLLVDAVHRVSEGYVTSEPRNVDSKFTEHVERFKETMRSLGVDAVVGEDLWERQTREKQPLARELVEDLKESSQ